jgi:predicted outer membrane repeat protein
MPPYGGEAGGNTQHFVTLGGPPVASFEYLPEKPMVREEVEFDASRAEDPNPNGRIVKYSWDFGDSNEAEGRQVRHTYTTPGEYTVTLTVTDNHGLSDSNDKTLKVKGKEFMITFDDGPVPGNTENILEALKNIKVDGKPVVAGFFMLGVGCAWDRDCGCLVPDRFLFPRKGHVKGNEGLVTKVAGHHLVGVHTQNHPWFDDKHCSVDTVKEEISDCYDAIRQAFRADDPNTANRRKMFRPPYFRYTGNVRTAAEALHFQVVLGAGENEDAAVDVGGKECSTARDLMEAWDKPYPCVLTFHDHLHQTAESIVEAIECLQKDGFTLVNFDPDRVSQPESGGEASHMLSGIARCPVDLVVTDPQGLVLSQEQNEIPDGMYEEFDEDGDGDSDDFFFIPGARPGDYLIQVVPEPNALPDEGYSLEVDVDGEIKVLAQDVPIRSVPREPYVVTVEGGGAEPRTWYVDAEATGGNDGTSWANALVHLQDVLAKARGGDTIWVAQGTYWADLGQGRTPGDRTATFRLQKGVAIYGGFPTGGSEWEQRDPVLHETILSGDIGTPNLASDNSYHVVTAGGTDKTAILDGFTIADGMADGDAPHDSGAGMCNLGGSPTVRCCVFLRNAAHTAGGGMANVEGAPYLGNCAFIGNVVASGNGGGVSNIGSAATFINCVFTGNTADKSGGGMYNEANDVTLINCTFSANESRTTGGGIYSSMCTATLANCVLWANTHRQRDRFGQSAQVFVFGGRAPVINYCCVQNWTGTLAGTGNIGSNPLFVDADGPDNIVGTLDDDLRLQAVSPCVNAGSNSAVPVDVTTDSDGKPRISNGIVDVGAYERQEIRGLMAYYPLDEGSGTVIVDASGNGRNGQVQDGPATWVNGQPGFGKALFFDGSNPARGYVNCGTWNPSGVTGRLTVAFWIKWTGTNANWQGVVAKRDGWDPEAAPPMMWYIECNQSTGEIALARRGSYPSGAGTPPTGQWTHVAFAFDGTTLRSYMNGVEVGSGTFSFGAKLDAVITIGCDNNGGYNGFNGAIDDVRIYDHALSPEEVQKLSKQP